jgi:hypothetical protein
VHAVPAAVDDTLGVEHPEMLRDVLLGGAERVGEVVDGRLAVTKTVEEADPHRLAENPEALGDPVDERRWKWVDERHVEQDSLRFYKYTTEQLLYSRYLSGSANR